MPRRKRHARREEKPNGEQLRDIFVMNIEACTTAFKMEALYQRFCQHPDCETSKAPWEAHHAMYEQHVKKYSEDPRTLWHPDNALRLCKTCHKQGQHGRKNPVPVCALRTENIEFTARLMGPEAAYEYFGRYYKGTDPRLEALIGNTTEADPGLLVE